MSYTSFEQSMSDNSTQEGQNSAQVINICMWYSIKRRTINTRNIFQIITKSVKKLDFSVH